MQIQKWLGLFGFLILPFLMIGCGVTVANETYVRVGFIDAGGNQIELALDNPDATQGINFKVVPANATVRNVTFESKNPSIAEVDSTGRVRGVGVGTTYVTITSVADQQVKADVKVRVVAKKTTLATPEDLQFDNESMELVWSQVKVSNDSNFTKVNYKLEIEATDLNATDSLAVVNEATTSSTRYSNFESDKIYKVRVKALGNGSSYLDSNYTQEYKFVKLSDPTTTELVRLADFYAEGGLTEEEYNEILSHPCVEEYNLNPNFKIRFPVNPLILSELQQTQNSSEETSEPEKQLSDYYDLVVVNANNSQDLNLTWEQAFSETCLRLCRINGDNTWYGCFSVPNNISNLEYKVWVKIKSGITLKNGCNVFSAGNANLTRVTQLRSPINLMIRQNSTGDVQLSWDPVGHAMGYVLEFRYTLENALGEESNVSHRVEISNRTFITLNDIKQINPDAVLEEFKNRDIYIYAKAYDRPIGGISYADSNLSSRQALEQLPAVTKLVYNRETGFVSWNRIEGDSLSNSICQYSLYVSKNTDNLISPDDLRVYNSIGWNGAQSVENQILYPIASSPTLQDGENFLKIVAVPLDTGADPSKQKYASSSVTTSDKFLKLNSVSNLRMVVPNLVDGERQLSRVVWNWSPSNDLSDLIDSLNVQFEVHFRVNGVDVVGDNNQSTVMYVDYDTEESEFGFDLGGENCPVKLNDGVMSQRFEIVVKVIANVNESVITITNLIDSKDQSLDVERYSAPIIKGTKNGALNAEVVYNAIVADDTGESFQTKPVSVTGYEILIENIHANTEDLLFFRGLANLNVTLDEYVKKYNAEIDSQIELVREDNSLDQDERQARIDSLSARKFSNDLTIRLRAVAFNENQDQFYLTQSNKNVYFVDGFWSSKINIVKLDAPTNLRIENGALVWDNFDATTLISKFGRIPVGYDLNITFKSGDGYQTTNQFVTERANSSSTSSEVQSKIPYTTAQFEEYLHYLSLTEEERIGVPVPVTPPQATIRTLLIEDDKTYRDGDSICYLISSGNSAPINVVQCDEIELSLNSLDNYIYWNAIDGIENFLIKVKDNNTDTYLDTIVLSQSDVSVVDQSTNEANSTPVVKYYLTNWSQNAGSYTFYVYAQGNNKLLSGVNSRGQTLVKLEAPENIRIENGLLQWAPVTYSNGNDGYEDVKKFTIVVTNLGDVEQQVKSITVTNAWATNLDSLASWIEYNKIEIEILSEGPEGQTNIIPSEKRKLTYSPSPASIVVPTVFKWTTITTNKITLNKEENKISWRYDNNHDGLTKLPNRYKVSITIPETLYNPASSTVIETVETELDLSNYTMFGHYVIQIQAMGRNEDAVMILNGTAGSQFDFYRMPNTDVLSIVREDDDLDPLIKWKKVSYSRENTELVDDYNIVINSKKANSSTVVIKSLKNIIATNTLRVADGETSLIVEDGDYLSITASNLSILYPEISFVPGEYAIYVQTVPVTNLALQLMPSSLTRFTTLYIFDAPMVTLDPVSGNLEITKSYQKNNLVKLIFTPVTVTEGTNRVYSLENRPLEEILSFAGSTYVYDTHDIESVMKNGSDSYLSVNNFAGFVLSVQAIGERNYVSSNLVSTELFYQRIAPIEYKYQLIDGNEAVLASGWYVFEGQVKWQPVEGASDYYFKIKYDDYDSIVSVPASNEEMVMSNMADSGSASLSVSAAGGVDMVSAKLNLGGKQYTKAYLTSDYSTPKTIYKLASPTGARIITEGEYKGEFDFGTRDANGNMQFGTGISAYAVQYYDKTRPNFEIAPWKINALNKGDYFIASEEIYKTNDVSAKVFDLKLYSIGNTPLTSSTMPYISSNASVPFTIYIPGKLDEIGFTYENTGAQKGNLKWNVLSLTGVTLENPINVELAYGSEAALNAGTATKISTSGENPTLRLNKVEDNYYFSFEGTEFDLVKGQTFGVKVRYQGQNLGDGAIKTSGIVNSVWADSINVYKLPDFADKNIYNLTTKLWSNVNDGLLNWKFSTNTPNGFRNACVWYDEVAEEKGNIEAYEVRTENLVDSRVKVYLQNKVANKYYDNVYRVLNSDVASQTFYKVDNITQFYTYKDCRVGWELTTAQVEDEDDNACELQPTKLIVYYEEGLTKKNHEIDIKNAYVTLDTKAFDLKASTGMWEIGSFENVRAIAVGAVFNAEGETVGMTLGSNTKSAINPSIDFNFYAAGAGTRDNPYQIDSSLVDADERQAALRNQLTMMRYLNDMFFILKTDISLANQDGVGNNYGLPTGFDAEPTQFTSLEFTGGFDGNNHTISNIQSKSETSFGWWNKIVSSTWSNEYDTSKAFFGLDGVVMNLTLQASLIEVAGFTKDSASGLLAKVNNGYILNCKSAGSMGSSGALHGYEENTSMTFGGLVGIHSSEFKVSAGVNLFVGAIQNCVNELPITIVFKDSGEGRQVSQAHSIVGGVVGTSQVGLIAGCRNTASITSVFAGGIIGRVYGLTGETAKAYVTGCENSGAVTSQIHGLSNSWHGIAGGIVARCEYGYIMASINSGTVTHGTTWDSSNTRCIGGIVGDVVSTNVYVSVHTVADDLWVIGHDTGADYETVNSDNLNTVFYCAWTNGVNDSDINGNKTLNNITSADLNSTSYNGTISWGKYVNLNNQRACVEVTHESGNTFTLTWKDINLNG